MVSSKLWKSGTASTNSIFLWTRRPTKMTPKRPSSTCKRKSIDSTVSSLRTKTTRKMHVSPDQTIGIAWVATKISRLIKEKLVSMSYGTQCLWKASTNLLLISKMIKRKVYPNLKNDFLIRWMSQIALIL